MNQQLQKDLQWAQSNERKIDEKWHSMKGSPMLDKTVNEAHNVVFSKIDCLSCANCCKTTGPLFTPQDVGRISKHLKVSEKDFTATYLKVDEDGDRVLKRLPCSFLGDDNRCSIYDIRPRACRAYPHTDQKAQKQIFDLTRKNARICPAVAQILKLALGFEKR